MSKRKKQKVRPLFGVGDRVRVKRGTACPYYPDIPIGGWVGNIVCVESAHPPLYAVLWSDETMKDAHPVYHKRCQRDCENAAEADLPEECLELDRGEPVCLEQPTNLVTRPLTTSTCEDRTRTIFGLTSDDPLPAVDSQAVCTYGDYLRSHLTFPFEGFLFAEPDTSDTDVTVLGMKEPSPVGETSPDGEPPDLIVRARRGAEEIELPLSALDVYEDTPNCELVEDYREWFLSGTEPVGDADDSWDDEHDGFDDEDDECEYDDDQEGYEEDRFLPEAPVDSPYLPPVPRLTKQEKVGRNDPCPCGSGKKYKKCCLNKNKAGTSSAAGRQPQPPATPRPLGGLSNLPATPDKTAHQLKVSLLGIEPPIWRRFQVRDCTLETLSGILQSVMGWSGEHLYGFQVGDKRYADPRTAGRGILAESGADTTTVSRIARKGAKSFTYTYDFGDSWEHEIVIEETLPAEHAADYPVCIAGQRACPPEDCGGVWGYEELLQALQEPDEEDNRDRLEWLGEFDPEEFDLEEVNRHLQWARRP